MDEKIKSSLRFLDYVVENIDFRINKYFFEEPIEVNFTLKKKIEYKDDENNTMYVTIEAMIFDNAHENNYPFSMNVALTGTFELASSDIDRKESFAEVNAVAILFPYLRSLVSTFTANANIQPLILPPINVMRLMED